MQEIVNHSKKMFKKMFPPKRIFASHVQLGQVVSKFAEKWTFGVTQSGNPIQCHFGKPTYKKCTKDMRKQQDSLKESIKCPF